ncbi:kinase-like protein, partial [Glonium stellatum]
FLRTQRAVMTDAVDVQGGGGYRHMHFEEESSWLYETVAILGSGRFDPISLALIMSPVADCNLFEFLADVRSSPRKKSLLRSFFGCLTASLAYLHNAQIRHKDIKPQNILVKENNVLLADFGLSIDWSESKRGTTEGATALSPRYCAPEVIDYEPRNSSSDIWSLGCVFLDIVTVLKGETVKAMRGYFEFHGS